MKRLHDLGVMELMIRGFALGCWVLRVLNNSLVRGFWNIFKGFWSTCLDELLCGSHMAWSLSGWDDEMHCYMTPPFLDVGIGAIVVGVSLLTLLRNEEWLGDIYRYALYDGWIL